MFEKLLIYWNFHTQSPDFSPIEKLGDVVQQEISMADVELTNLQSPCDAIISMWIKTKQN